MTPNQYADEIWKIKEYLRDDYAEKEYEDVILPFTLLRRIDCVLERTHDKVVETLKKYKVVPENTLDALLKKASGYNFYNISPFTLSSLLADEGALDENFKNYLEGFSDNIKDILYNFSGGKEKGLSPIYETLYRKELLYKVTLQFTNQNLHPDYVSNHNMGTLFEVLIRKSKETSGEKAGQYYTPREIVKLMVNIVFANQHEKLTQKGAGCLIYDPACGTGGMLTTAKEHLIETVNPKLDIYLFGQELKEQTYAICKSDILIKGENVEHIKQGNTISNDKLTGKRFHYMLTNPPFGEDWKKISEFVEAEEARGENGRFEAGTPDKSDGSLLFLQHMMSKMEPSGSIIGIVFNGSPLFNGDAGSGPSNIRKWIIENDRLDAIIALPKDLFFGTGIVTYIWIVTNKKKKEREGKVQLINASSFYTPLDRSLGKKMVEISDEQINDITKLYTNFYPNDKFVKIFNNNDFRYTKVTVDRPLRLSYSINEEQIAALKEAKGFASLAELKRSEILLGLNKILAEKLTFTSDSLFLLQLQKYAEAKFAKGIVKLIRSTFGVKNEDADKVLINPFQSKPPKTGIMDSEPQKWFEIDTELRDSESISHGQDIEAYFKREVLPYAPDAWMDRSKDKIGYTIGFTKYFYEYKPLRSLADIRAEYLVLEEEAEKIEKSIFEK